MSCSKLLVCSLSLRSVSRRRSRLHECTPCRSIPSALPCRRQTKTERAQIVLDRSQPCLPGSSGSASPVYGRTPKAGLESSGMVLIGICTTEVTKEGQTPSTDSFHVIRDKIRPVNVEDTSKTPSIQWSAADDKDDFSRFSCAVTARIYVNVIRWRC